jgi:hypothetical protein
MDMDIADNEQKPSEPSRRKLLRNGLLLGAAVAGVSVASGALTDSAQASTSGPEPEWAWCHDCNALFFYPNRSNSICPLHYQGAGGWVPHTISTSFNYGLNYDDTVHETNPQSTWNWCGVCQGLFYSPNINQSYCPRGGTHTSGNGSVQSYNYALYHDNPNLNGGQGGWYWCSKCQGLWYGGSSRQNAICPKDAGEHNGKTSDQYYLFYYSKSIT